MARMNELMQAQGNEPGDDTQKAVSFRTLAAATPAVQTVYAGPDWYRLAHEALGRLVPAGQQATPFQLDGMARIAMMVELTKIATCFVDSLQQSDHFLTKAMTGQAGTPVISNMVNVSVLAVKLGMGLGYQREALVGLALAGLLHDVGMLQVPGTILDNPGKLSDEDRARIKQHPEASFQLLSKLGSPYTWLAQIAFQEHERWDGQGYPRGLKGDHIDEYARIIGLVDNFEALMNPRPYRKRLLPHEAVRELLVAGKASFPSQIVKAFVQQFALFPLGTRVKLNTGELGVVSKLNQRYPLRPVLLIDKGGVPGASPRTVDLSVTTLVHIVEVIGSDAGGEEGPSGRGMITNPFTRWPRRARRVISSQ